jgi:Ca-activated chloride channel homolog
MFRFASPYLLSLLALIPLTIWYRRRNRKLAALAGSGLGAAGRVNISSALVIGRYLPLLFYLALLLMILALARPQHGTRQMQVSDSGINIVLAVDISESMAALDFKYQGEIINRLEAVKMVVNTFIKQRSGDRIGLVVFGSQAYTQLPLTRDYGAIATILTRIEIGAAGRATAMGDAIGIALKRLTDVKSRSNIIIMLTDGRSNSGEFEPQTTAEIAKQKGVKIYTIGVGGKGRAPFLVNDPIFGQRYQYQRVDLDEATLQAIADQTGGLYFNAKDLEGLQKIYATIDAMEKTEVKINTFDEYNELYIYLLLPAFVLLALWVVLKNSRFLRIP